MRILVLFLLSFLTILAKAQHNHFIYIQGDNQQNFYIRKGADLLSSSTSGFIILPKLEPGTHQFTIGFPKDQWPEYEFSIDVKDRDRGFTLRNFQDKGWGLFDMQSMDIIMGRRIEVKKEEKPPIVAMTDDPFSVILASVVDDPRIRETSLISSASMVSAPVIKPADKQDMQVVAKTDAKPPVLQQKPAGAEVKTVDEQRNVNTLSTETKPLEEPKANAGTSKPPLEEKKLPEVTVPVTVPEKEQVTIVAAPPVLKDEAKVDTAKDKPIPKKEQQALPPAVIPSTAEAQKEETTPAETKEKYTAQKVRKISELKTWNGYTITYIDLTGPTPDTIYVSIEDTLNTSSEVVRESQAAPLVESRARMPRTDCKKMAREKDVLAIRKKMLLLTDDAAMVGVVIKEVKSKCFTTDQLQNLSYVFVNDKGRYQLFDEAFPFIFDPANYQRLEKLFNSDEYTNKFRALIKSN